VLDREIQKLQRRRVNPVHVFVQSQDRLPCSESRELIDQHL
jgi:hypothetical protein